MKLRNSGLLGIAGLLAIALTAFPAVATAQTNPTPVAMTEASPTDINAWGFAAVVPVGGMVTWTNMGSQAHTVTASDGSFDTGLVNQDASASIEFDTPGVFAYTCSPHPWMKGFVVVTADAPGPTPMAMIEGNRSDINSWGFGPSIAAGTSVTWTNLGAQAHTVTAPDGSFDTGLVAPGSTGQVEFDTPGIFSYACTPHPWMKGSVTVN